MRDTTTSRPNGQPTFDSRHRLATTRMRSRSSFFIVYHDFIRHLGLSIEEAAVLSDMINTAEMTKAEYRDGWFDYTVDWMRSRTGIEIKAQQRVINVLKDGGWITVAKAGNPARRRIRINSESIENTINEGLINSSEVEIDPTAQVEIDLTRGLEIDPTPSIKQYKPTLTKTGGGRKEGKLSKPSESTSLVNQPTKLAWETKMARWIKDILVKHKMISSYSEGKWAKEFVSLRASLDGNERVIEETLEEFDKHQEELLVRISSATSFKEKFNKLLDALSAIKAKRTGLRPNAQSCAPPAPPIPELPEEVRDDLEEIQWPSGQPEDLASFYLRCLNTAQPIIDRLNKLSDHEELGDMAGELLYRLGAHRDSMALKWVRLVALDVKGWKAWSRSFKGRELDVRTVFFEKVIKAIGKAYDGRNGERVAGILLNALR